MSQVMVCLDTNNGAFILRSDGARTEWEIEGPILAGWSIRDICLDTRGDKPVLWAGLDHEVYGPSIQRSFDFG